MELGGPRFADRNQLNRTCQMAKKGTDPKRDPEKPPDRKEGQEGHNYSWPWSKSGQKIVIPDGAVADPSLPGRWRIKEGS